MTLVTVVPTCAWLEQGDAQPVDSETSLADGYGVFVAAVAAARLLGVSVGYKQFGQQGHAPSLHLPALGIFFVLVIPVVGGLPSGVGAAGGRRRRAGVGAARLGADVWSGLSGSSDPIRLARAPSGQPLAVWAGIRGFHPDRRNVSVSCASRLAAASAAADCLACCCAALAAWACSCCCSRARVSTASRLASRTVPSRKARSS